MLLKLIKRDVMSVKIMYLAFLAILPNAFILRFSEILPEFVVVLLGLSMFFLTAIVICGTWFSILYSYYDDFIGKRAYLYHTIPASIELKLISKLLYSYLIGFMSIVSLILTAVLVAGVNLIEFFDFFFGSFKFLFELMKENPFATLNVMLILPMLPAISLHRYFISMTMSQFRSLTKNRIVDSIIWYIMFGMALRFIVYFAVDINLISLLENMSPVMITFIALLLNIIWLGCLFMGNVFLFKKKIQVQ